MTSAYRPDPLILELGDAFYDAVEPAPFPSCTPRFLNKQWAERIGLGDFVESGSAMQAKVSADLLQTIFTPYSPLHAGAVVVRGDTIVGAGCILPLTQRSLTDRSLGTRHRAALGLSEESDAMVIIVSEESAQISVANGGRLLRDVSPAQVRDILAGKPPRTTGGYPVVGVGA